MVSSNQILLVGRDWSVDQKNRLGLEEFLYWRSFICQINHFKAGERFGYNRSFTAEQDMTVAIASFGYSDGYPDDMVRHGASVILKGKRARILSMNMDQCFIDITGIENVRINDQVLIMGRDGEEELTVDEVLQDTPHVRTYVLSMISPRVRRIIKYRFESFFKPLKSIHRRSSAESRESLIDQAGRTLQKQYQIIRLQSANMLQH